MSAATAVRGDDFERMPPHDVQAEQGALGGMLLSKDAILDVEEAITPEDHYRPAHQMIHEAILAVRDRGEPVDALTVAEELVKRGEIARIGGKPYLHTLIAMVPTAANAGYYARIVRERAILRRLVEAGTRIVQLGYMEGADADDVQERAALELDKVGSLCRVEPVQSSADLLNEVLDELSQAVDPGLTTGWTDLDDVFRLNRSEFTVIAARTSVGKSIGAINMAEHIGTALRLPCLYASLEMGRHELMRRRIAAAARVPLHNLNRHQVDDLDMARIGRVYADLAESELVIDDNPIVGLTQVRKRIRDMTRLGKAPRAVFIDLMSLMQEPPGAESRRVAVDGLSRGLKLISREFDISVVALVQINRGPEGRTDKRPLLSDLRESGAIEADADNVLIFHREDYHEKESPRAGEIDVIIAKHRNGPTCTVTLAFQGHYARMTSMAPA